MFEKKKRSIVKSKLLPAGSALLLGMLFATGFAPWSFSWVAVLALTVLFGTLWKIKSPRAAFSIAYCFSLGWFSIGLSWTINSMAEHGRLPLAVAFGGLFLLAALLSLLPALAAWVSKKWAADGNEFPYVLASLFLIAEYVRGDCLLNFGWLTPAYAFMETPWVHWATLGGVYAVNLAVVLSIALVLSGLKRLYESRFCLTECLVFILILGGAAGIGIAEWSQPGPKLEVRVMQPNLPVVDAWTRVSPSERIEALLPLAKGNWQSQEARLTVTPEGLVNTVISRLDTASVQALFDLQRTSESPILFNGFRKDGRAFFNTEFLLTEKGVEYRLDKRHLVPFGEFVPAGARWFVDVLGIPMSDLVPGESRQPTLKLGDVTLGILICYENLYGNVMRSDLGSGYPNIMIVTANLGWFAQSVVGQHLDMSRMRAMEFARPIVQVNNTGGSALISAEGDILETLASEGCDARTMLIQGGVGSPTPYARFGNYPALISTGLLLIVSFFRRRRSLKKMIFCH